MVSVIAFAVEYIAEDFNRINISQDNIIQSSQGFTSKRRFSNDHTFRFFYPISESPSVTISGTRVNQALYTFYIRGKQSDIIGVRHEII